METAIWGLGFSPTTPLILKNSPFWSIIIYWENSLLGGRGAGLILGGGDSSADEVQVFGS